MERFLHRPNRCRYLALALGLIAWCFTGVCEAETAEKKPYILVQYHDLYESRLGDYPQNNTAWMISADYLRGEVHGDVSSATINDPSPFASNRLEWMLGDLAGRTVANASAIVVLEASATIAFATDADQETRLNEAVVTNPANSTRNQIVSQGANVRPLAIQSHADQTADLMQILDATESVLARINDQGYLGVGVDPVAPIESGGSMRVGGMVGDGTDGEFQYDGTTFKGWHDGAWRDFLSAEEILAGTGWVKSTTETVTNGLVAFFTNPTTIRGATEFSWNNSTKILNILGGINATTLQGNGANVTNVNALQLGGLYASSYLTEIVGSNLDNIFTQNGFLKRTSAGNYTATYSLDVDRVDSEYGYGVNNVADMSLQGDSFRIESQFDIRLAPTGTAKITAATLMEFDDFLGDKIRFYSHSYSIGVSAFDLDITSDRNIKFHSDTVPDLVQIIGDIGDLIVKHDVESGGVYKFSADTTGDKLLLYSTLYRLAVSSNTFDAYSDWYFKWHSDSNSDAMILDANTGNLTIEGTFTGNGSGLTNISIPWTSLTGNPSSVIALQAPLYWVNGNTIGIQDYYVKKSGDTMSGTLNMNNNIIRYPRIQLNPSSSATGLLVGEIRLYVPN